MQSKTPGYVHDTLNAVLDAALEKWIFPQGARALATSIDRVLELAPIECGRVTSLTLYDLKLVRCLKGGRKRPYYAAQLVYCNSIRLWQSCLSIDTESVKAINKDIKPTSVHFSKRRIKKWIKQHQVFKNMVNMTLEVQPSRPVEFVRLKLVVSEGGITNG